MPALALQNKQYVIDDLIERYFKLLQRFPGKPSYNFVNNAYEWRTDYLIDIFRSPSNTHYDDQYQLIFTLSDSGNGNISAGLCLDHHNIERQIHDIYPITISDTTTMYRELEMLCTKLVMHRQSFFVGTVLIDKIVNAKRMLSHQFDIMCNIVSTSSKV